jgi:RNA polymerase sigma-70 factor, ECF subfamily
MIEAVTSRRPTPKPLGSHDTAFAQREKSFITNELFGPGLQLTVRRANMAVTSEQLYEQTLVVRSQIGDEAAFAELLKLYGPRLLLFTQRMMQSSPEQVADVTQETWLSIFRGIPRLLDVSKFKPWAFRIARDQIYREFRRRKMSVQPLDKTIIDELPDEGTDSAIAIDSEQLQQCLKILSPEHREALVLRFFEDMSYEEIARITGVTVGTIRSRIHYGKQALKNLWKEKTL